MKKTFALLAIWLLCSGALYAQKSLKKAKEQNLEFWELVKQKKYKETYVFTHAMLQESVSEQAWIDLLSKDIADKIGAPKEIDSSPMFNVSVTTLGPLGKGTYVALMYKNTYELATAWELTVYYSESKKEPLKIVHYYLNTSREAVKAKYDEWVD